MVGNNSSWRSCNMISLTIEAAIILDEDSKLLPIVIPLPAPT
jgi:hypothetical protein